MNLEEATKPELSCRAASNVPFFDATYGRPRLEKVLQQIGAPFPAAYLFDLRNFVSLDFTVLLLEGMERECGDPDFALKIGQYAASPQGLGFVYYMLRALATPRLGFEKLMQLGPTYNKVGEFTLDSISDTDMRLRYRSRLPEKTRHVCQVRLAQFAAFPTIWGVPNASAVEHECQVNGAEACVYEFHWRRTSNTLPAIAGSAAVGAAVLGFALARPLGVTYGALVGLVFGGLFGMVYGYRRQNKLLREQLTTQDEGMTLSMRDLVTRMDEIKELNENLEKRVEDRTQALSLASTQLQAALEKQLELDRLKTQFFQNISHELRTPLTLILAPLDTLSDEPNLEDSTRMQLSVMRRSALRLLGMINSLLDLSRLEAGKMRLALEDLDPAVICYHLVENAQQLALKRSIKLTFDGPERLPLVPLDQDKFEKAVLNLISNALKFTGTEPNQPSEVHVATEIVEDRLIVTVRDTGIGIPEDELQNIFLRFHQVDNSDERRFGGTGIGLALVKELTEFHMGAVQVESKPGVGSTFKLVLPTSIDVYPDERLDRRRAAESVAVDRRKEQERSKLAQLIANPSELVLADLKAATQPALSPEATSPRPRVLLADDNPDMLSYLATILSREYEVITAADGEEAFSLASQYIPHIVVSDVMMPRMNGYALVKALKGIPALRSIPIVLVTAKAESYQKVAGIESGADDYITKPFNFQELRARIRQLLKARALERSLAEKNEYLAKLNFDLVLSKKEVFVQTIEALAFALEAKDPYTHGHSRRVSLLSTELSRTLGLSELEIERVRMSAILHDIGKLGIPEHILRKDGRLSEEEENIIRMHPEIGARILESVRELGDVGQCILRHHERFDGTGYPARKGGKDIPLESRIIAVADTYDAMTSDRPYRKGLGHKRAIEELRMYAGTQFDPDCVATFLRLYEGQEPSFPDFPSVFARIGS